MTEKPIVHYRGKARIEGGFARLWPLDHPNHLDGHCISNAGLVRTSTVLSHKAGRIETLNTVYLPETTQETA